MSRSRRRLPIIAHTCSGYRHGEKDDKRQAHRQLRRRVRVAIQKDAPLPLLREVSNVWNFRKDGKQWCDTNEWPRPWQVWGK